MDQEQAKAEVASLEAERSELLARLAQINAKVASFKTKCPTCRCKILPWAVCGCCAEPTCLDDFP